MKTHLLVWLSLMLLLGLTVVAWQYHLGFLMALAIAVTKAALVIAFFMHLRKESPLTKFVAGAVLFWLLILFGFTLADYFSRLGF
ncbi:MAG TPA: caa(3)-type oxidase subunit IV [Phycisphaerales bacterium]|nr:caa(3)-type oxidase subunit IV [Phycisphaerales bacterium]